MSILITGASGFIGTNLVYFLSQKKNEEVISLYYQGNNKENMNRIESYSDVMCCDIRNFNWINSIVERTKPGTIFHLAAESGVKPSVDDPQKSLDINVIGTYNVLEAARNNNVMNFVFASSCGAVLGDRSEELSSDMSQNPKSPYGSFKASCEHLCNAYKNTYGMNAKVARFSNVFGEYSKHKKSIIANYIKASINNDIFELNGDGEQIRDFVYVQNLISDLDRIFTQSKDIVHLANGYETSINEIIHLLDMILIRRGFNTPQIIKKEKSSYDVRKCIVQSDMQSGHNDLLFLENTVDWFINSIQEGI